MPNIRHGVWSEGMNYENPIPGLHRQILDHINSPNSFWNEKEYINLLSGEYDPIDDRGAYVGREPSSLTHAKGLFGATPEETVEGAKKELEEHKQRMKAGRISRLPPFVEQMASSDPSLLANGALKNSKFNNPETNAKVLAALEKKKQEYKEAAQKDIFGTKELRGKMYPGDADKIIETLINNANLRKEDIAKHFKNPAHAKNILQNKVKDQEFYDYLMSGLDPSEVRADHLESPFLNDTHIRKILNSKSEIDTEAARSIAKKNMMPPNHAERFLKEHASWLDQEYADLLLGSLPKDRRESFLNKKLGIEGGNHIKPKPEKLEDWDTQTLSEKQNHWDNQVNWKNWKNGPEKERHHPELWPKSKYLTENQIEHIKRHGGHDEKYALFYNDNVDPAHGGQMWEKWAKNDIHHGYSFNDLQNDYRKSIRYDNDSLRDEAMNRAENEYPIEEFINDNYENGRVYDDDTLEEYIKANPHKFKTTGENPNFDPLEEEHPEKNSRYIDFADFSSGGGHAHLLSDHPNYEEMINEANEQMKQKRGIPNSVWSDYKDHIDDNIGSYRDEVFTESLKNFHKKWENLPPHLKNKIPQLLDLRRADRADETKETLIAHSLGDPYRKGSKEEGWSPVDKSLIPNLHEYAPGLHHHQMVKDFADANGGKVDLGTLVKKHPNLKDKFKEILENKNSITSEEVQEKIDKMPKTKYGISMTPWGSQQPQNINKQDQIVIRLDHSPESYKQFENDPELLDTFKAIQDSSERSGHPTNEDTIAWARVDTSNPKHWMIDELQSDFGSSLRSQIERAEEGDPDKKTKILNHLTKIEDAHKDWRENIMNYVINLAKKHGVEKLSTHSPESKAAHTNAQAVHTVYNDSYKKIPRQLGFKAVPGENLPLSDKGKEIFKRAIRKKIEFSPEELLQGDVSLTPHQYRKKLYQDAMEHHLRQAHLHKEMASGDKFSQNPNQQMGAPSDFPVATAEQHSKLFEQHKKKFFDLKSAAITYDPTHEYAHRINFSEHQNKALKNEDFQNAAAALENDSFAPHRGDVLAQDSEQENFHQGHTLDLKSEAFKKSEVNTFGLGEIFAIKLMEIL